MMATNPACTHASPVQGTRDMAATPSGSQVRVYQGHGGHSVGSAFITFQLLNTPADPGFWLRFRCGPVLTYARTLRVRSSRKPRQNPGLAGGQLKDLAKGQLRRGASWASYLRTP